MWSLLRSVRYMPRYRHIVAVLTRHGLGWLADQAGLTRFVTRPRRLFRRARPVQPLPSLAQRLCRALEELGPSFILLGRYLSTRVDLLPPVLCRELTCLPPSGPALPAAEVRQLLEEEFGRPLAEVFSEFASEPWRCTWLEQVHCARTPAGREVWVAVPNGRVRACLENDRPLLQDLARQIDERHLIRNWSATTILQEFRAELRQQSETRERSNNAARWQRHFAERGQPAFPEVDAERTTAHVLTCQALPGRPLAEIAATAGEAPSLARILYRFFAQAIFVDGFYPAPAALEGLIVLADGRLAATVLAPAGHLDSTMRQELLRLLECFRAEDIGEIVAAAVTLGLIESRQVGMSVYQVVRHLIDRYHDLPLDEACLLELAEDIFALAGRQAITLPEELTLLLCTLVVVESQGQRLAPQVSAAAEMAPLVQQAMASLHSWEVRQERILRSAQAWLEALRTFPVDMRHLLSQATAGDLLVGVEPRGWQKPMRRLERMVYRLVLSVVAAGLLVGISLLVTALLPASWGPWGWILAGLAVFSLLGLGFLLFLSFLRRQ